MFEYIFGYKEFAYIENGQQLKSKNYVLSRSRIFIGRFINIFIIYHLYSK